MKTQVRLGGNIIFNPTNFTRKHNNQAQSRKVAILFINGDWDDYYAWFLKKKGLILNPPQRGAHITIINDSYKKIKGNNDKQRLELWDKVAIKYNKRFFNIELELTPLSDGKHWWMRIPRDKRGKLQKIRDELGIGQYTWGFHMTLGYANEYNINHSQYLRHLHQYGFNNKKTQNYCFKTLKLPYEIR